MINGRDRCVIFLKENISKIILPFLSKTKDFNKKKKHRLIFIDTPERTKREKKCVVLVAKAFVYNLYMEITVFVLDIYLFNMSV
jgi:hypothetical protein